MGARLTPAAAARPPIGARRWVAGLLVAAALPDAALALLASTYLLYYAAVVLLLPLLALRLWVTVEAAWIALRGGTRRAWRRVWTMELVHALVVVLALLGMQHNLVVRTLWPGSEAAHALLAYDRDLAAWILNVAWPWAMLLASAAGAWRAWTNPDAAAV